MEARPWVMSFSAAIFSGGVSVLFMPTAQTPLSKRLSTWSFISEMSGLTTTVIPSECVSAVSWKQRLLPEPVGMMTSVSRPVMAESTAWACPGRKLRKPKKLRILSRRCSSRNGGDGGGSGVGAFGFLVRLAAGFLDAVLEADFAFGFGERFDGLLLFG